MDLYKLLGVGKEADKKEIRKAYLNLSKIHHPDKGGDEEEFKKINEAYNILSDPDLRAAYDAGKSLDSLRKGSNELMKRAFSVFEESIQDFGFVPDHTNLFTIMREKCNEKDLRMDRDIEKLNGEIRNTEAIQKRMRNADMFKNYLDGSIEDRKHRIKTIEKEKEYIEQILNFIENCEYDIDEDDDYDIPPRRFLERFA